MVVVVVREVGSSGPGVVEAESTKYIKNPWGGSGGPVVEVKVVVEAEVVEVVEVVVEVEVEAEAETKEPTKTP